MGLIAVLPTGKSPSKLQTSVSPHFYKLYVPAKKKKKKKKEKSVAVSFLPAAKNCSKRVGRRGAIVTSAGAGETVRHQRRTSTLRVLSFLLPHDTASAGSHKPKCHSPYRTEAFCNSLFPSPLRSRVQDCHIFIATG